MEKQPLDVFYKKAVLRNVSKFVEKYPCLSLYFNTAAGLRFQLYQMIDSNTGVFPWILWKFFKDVFLSQSTTGRLLLDVFFCFDFRCALL